MKLSILTINYLDLKWKTCFFQRQYLIIMFNQCCVGYSILQLILKWGIPSKLFEYLNHNLEDSCSSVSFTHSEHLGSTFLDLILESVGLDIPIGIEHFAIFKFDCVDHTVAIE